MTTDSAHNANVFASTFLFFADTHCKRKKIKKSLQANAQGQQTMDIPIMTEKEQRRHNSTYPKGGVSCFADTFVQAESSVLRMKFSGKIPALRVAANR